MTELQEQVLKHHHALVASGQFPSAKRIRDLMGLGGHAVRDARRQLIRAGLIVLATKKEMGQFGKTPQKMRLTTELDTTDLVQKFGTCWKERQDGRRAWRTVFAIAADPTQLWAKNPFATQESEVLQTS